MPAHRRRFCIRGHDTQHAGRDAEATCRECRREKALARATAHRRENTANLNAIKMFFGCKRCGYKRVPEALHFHHRDPKTKLQNIAKTACACTWARVQREMVKCDILCANCHIELHTTGKAV